MVGYAKEESTLHRPAVSSAVGFKCPLGMEGEGGTVVANAVSIVPCDISKGGVSVVLWTNIMSGSDNRWERSGIGVIVIAGNGQWFSSPNILMNMVTVGCLKY